MTSFYKVRTRDGIYFHIEARNYEEAQLRASSPLIVRHITLMIQQAISQIESIEPHRGPKHLVKGALFEDALFNNLQK